MVEIFSISTAREAISLRQELYKLEMSREEGITSYFMKISELQDQLQEFGEEMSDREITRVMLCQRDGKLHFNNLWEEIRTTIPGSMVSMRIKRDKVKS